MPSRNYMALPEQTCTFLYAPWNSAGRIYSFVTFCERFVRQSSIKMWFFPAIENRRRNSWAVIIMLFDFDSIYVYIGCRLYNCSLTELTTTLLIYLIYNRFLYTKRMQWCTLWLIVLVDLFLWFLSIIVLIYNPFELGERRF